MKKLMFVAALAAAMTVSADVTSANIVGYNSDKTVSGTEAGSMTSSFGAIGLTGKYKLSNLSVSGYDPAIWIDFLEMLDGGCQPGAFQVQQLDGHGATTNTFYWVDVADATREHVQYEAGWYVVKSGAYEMIDGSIELDTCSCLWVFGKGLKLESSGQVVDSDIQVTTAPNPDACGVANGMAVNLTLDDLTVSGYDPAIWIDFLEMLDGGCQPGAFQVQQLDGHGATTNTLYWVDVADATRAHVQYEAGWYAAKSGAYEKIDATKIPFKSGDGFWVFGKGLKINVPCYKSKLAE